MCSNFFFFLSLSNYFYIFEFSACLSATLHSEGEQGDPFLISSCHPESVGYWAHHGWQDSVWVAQLPTPDWQSWGGWGISVTLWERPGWGTYLICWGFDGRKRATKMTLGNRITVWRAWHCALKRETPLFYFFVW